MKLIEKENEKKRKKEIDIVKAEEGLRKAKMKMLNGAILIDRRTYYPG